MYLRKLYALIEAFVTVQEFTCLSSIVTSAIHPSPLITRKRYNELADELTAELSIGLGLVGSVRAELGLSSSLDIKKLTGFNRGESRSKTEIFSE